MKTTITNKFDKSFGPVGSSAGIVFMIAGTALSFLNPGFILLVLFGAFVAFTNTSTTINTKEKKARYTSNIFGLIKLGKWINITSNMTVKIMRNNKSFRAYSRGNRQLVVKTHQYKVSLFDNDNKEVIPLKYFNNLSDGKEFIDALNARLANN